MTYIDFDALEAIDPEAFRATRPFPWVNPVGLLTPEGYRELRANLPDLALFERVFGKPRKYGQQSHDRYNLEYDDGLPVAQAWKDLVGELRGARYQGWLRRMLGVRSLTVRFHWHYTPKACSVSPHTDSKKKLASHIFYLNDADDWDAGWGGETVILDDEGRFERDSAPAFDDFPQRWVSQTMGNRSLLFMNGAHAWHGVREIDCPEGALRKVFIVVVDRPDLGRRLKDELRALQGQPAAP